MFVKSCIVDTDALYVGVFIWDNDWVRYPTRCFDFLDEPDIFQAMKFGCYCFVLWFIKSSKSLLYWSCLWIHI
jgi:hypothetical protein